MELNSLRENGLLKEQFSNLGFNLTNSMFETAIQLKNDVSVWSDHIENTELLKSKELVLFLCVVHNTRSNKNCCIWHINARFVANVPHLYEYQVISEKNYYADNGPLPKKDEILQGLLQIRKIDEVKDQLQCVEQLQDLFKSLGFTNFYNIIKTAHLLPKSLAAEEAYKCTFSMDDFDSDEEEIGYVFTVSNNNKTGKWQIESIRAGFQMNTERKIEGVTVIGKEYTNKDGKLPTKEQIRKEVLEMVRIEKVREELYLSENGNNTIYHRFRNPPF